MNVINCLRERGLIDAVTADDLDVVCSNPIKVYAGFDPSADSLHLGNLLVIVMLAWFQKMGHTPVIILGGATGRIGDPSGKSSERPLLDEATIQKNLSKIRENFQNILDFSCENRPVILDNYSWFSSFSLIDFLRDIGKHFRMGPMLSKESVKARIQSQDGLSFTEFSYQLLQGYDFYHLFEHYGVSLQIGGSDQWGNITAGVDLIRKIKGRSAFGLTFPLLTKSDGKKFGKSEQGAIWLSEEKCSAYEFYQFLFKVHDADVIKLLKMLTFMDLKDIRLLEQSMVMSDYIPNSAQKILAEEITRLVHGSAGLEKALKVTQGAAPGVSKQPLDEGILKEIASDMPHTALSKQSVLGCRFVDLAAACGIVSSKSEAVRLIQGGGAYLNNNKVENTNRVIGSSDVIGEKYVLLGMGKKKKNLIILE